MNIGGFLLLCIFAGVAFWLASIMKNDGLPPKNLPRTTAVFCEEFLASNGHDRQSSYRCNVKLLTPAGEEALGQSTGYSTPLGLEPGTKVDVFYRPVKQSRALELAQSTAEAMRNTMIHAITSKTPGDVCWPQYTIWFCDIRKPNPGLKK